MLEFRILGPLEVARDGEPVALGGPKQRATLAILLGLFLTALLLRAARHDFVDLAETGK